MVIKSATKKKLMDRGVPEEAAHKLADDRKWDDVKKLDVLSIAQLVYDYLNLLPHEVASDEVLEKSSEIYYQIHPEERSIPTPTGTLGLLNWWGFIHKPQKGNPKHEWLESAIENTLSTLVQNVEIDVDNEIEGINDSSLDILMYEKDDDGDHSLLGWIENRYTTLEDWPKNISFTNYASYAKDNAYFDSAKQLMAGDGWVDAAIWGVVGIQKKWPHMNFNLPFLMVKNEGMDKFLNLLLMQLSPYGVGYSVREEDNSKEKGLPDKQTVYYLADSSDSSGLALHLLEIKDIFVEIDNEAYWCVNPDVNEIVVNYLSGRFPDTWSKFLHLDFDGTEGK